jgi:hypothetical protein
MPNDISWIVKAKPFATWFQNTGKEFLAQYYGHMSDSDFETWNSFVNDNFINKKGGQKLTGGIDEVWDHYLNNGKDPIGKDSPDWRIYNEFEDTTPRLSGVFMRQLVDDVINKFWPVGSEKPDSAEEEMIGHICGLLAIHAAYKNKLLYKDFPENLSPSQLRDSVTPTNTPTPTSTDPRLSSLNNDLGIKLGDNTTPVGGKELLKIVPGPVYDTIVRVSAEKAAQTISESTSQYDRPPHGIYGALTVVDEAMEGSVDTVYGAMPRGMPKHEAAAKSIEGLAGMATDSNTTIDDIIKKFNGLSKGEQEEVRSKIFRDNSDKPSGSDPHEEDHRTDTNGKPESSERGDVHGR